MAHATICDMCEAIGRGDATSARAPAGWHTLRVETIEPVGSRHRSIHACSDGCAIRALATYLHDTAKERDERDRCLIAGCDEPAMPLRSCCERHEPSLPFTGAHGSAPPARESVDDAGASPDVIPAPDDVRCTARNWPPNVVQNTCPPTRCWLHAGHEGQHVVEAGTMAEWRWDDAVPLPVTSDQEA